MPFKEFGRRTHPREYSSWASMWTRVRNHNREDWRLYGGRGIRVCNHWKAFANFLKDMGVRPLGKSLDRLNSNKGYTVKNCRWATPKEQLQTRRKGHFRGEKNHRAKLTWDKVFEVRDLFQGEWTIEELAQEFKVSEGCISKIVYKNTWKER